MIAKFSLKQTKLFLNIVYGISFFIGAVAMLVPALMKQFSDHSLPSIAPLWVVAGGVGIALFFLASTANRYAKLALIAIAAVFVVMAVSSIGLP